MGSAHNQVLLDEATAEVDQDAPGFVEIRYDEPALKADIVWHGTPPDHIQDMVGTTKTGVKIGVVSVPYSPDEIGAAIDRARAIDSRLPYPVEMSQNGNWDGLVLGFLPEDFERVNTPAILKKFEQAARMPVEIVVSEGATDT